MRIYVWILFLTFFLSPFHNLLQAKRGMAYAPDQILVRFDKPTSLSEAKILLDGAEFKVSRVLVPQLDLYLVKLSPGLGVPTALDMMKGNPAIRYAQADHYLDFRTIPDDPQFGSQWNLSNVNDRDIDAPEAWDLSTGGQDSGNDDVVIAVVDGGGQTDHVDLLPNRWENPNEIPNNGLDDDFNGYVDDVYGWNAFSETGTIPDDDHGSHVTGIAAARGNNNTNICGVGWDIKVMYVAASDPSTSIISIGYGYVLTMKQLWISSGGQQGANIVVQNSSFGVDSVDCASGSFPVWNDLFDALGEVGVLSVGATINSNYNVDTGGDVPTGCASPYVISVTSTTQTDVKYINAGYGATTIDLAAPGVAIISTISPNTTSSSTGTSTAAPHVAGAVALMHAAASQDFYEDYVTYPDSMSLVLKKILLDSTDVLASLNGLTVTSGRLNLYRAVLGIRSYTGSGSTSPFLRYQSHVLEDSITGDDDGKFDKGETVRMTIEIDNIGSNATFVSGTLTTSDPYLSIIDNSADFGNVGSFSSANNAGDPFEMMALLTTPNSHLVSVDLNLNSLEGYSVTRTLSFRIGQKVIYFSDSVENGQGDWTHTNNTDGFGDQWHISTELFFSPGHSWKCGDTGTGNYAAQLDAALISPEVSITPNSALHFVHWIQGETSTLYPDSCFDGGNVWISANNGPYNLASPSPGYPKTFRNVRGGPVTGPMPGIPCFSGMIPWTSEEIDLSPYENQNIRVMFRFGSDNVTNREGWYVDDIYIDGDQPEFTPPEVTNLTIVPVEETSDIKLYWSAPQDSSCYFIIYRSTDPNIVPDMADSIGWTPGYEYTDFGVTASLPKVFYRIKTVAP